MAATVQINAVEGSGQFIIAYFTVVLSGSYVQGGDTVNFLTAIQGSGFIGQAGPWLPSSGNPIIDLDFWSVGGNLSNTYTPVIGTGASALSTCKIKVTTGSAGGASGYTELGAGAYPAAVTGDTINGQLVLNKLV